MKTKEEIRFQFSGQSKGFHSRWSLSDYPMPQGFQGFSKIHSNYRIVFRNENP